MLTHPKTVEIIWGNERHTKSFTGPRLWRHITANIHVLHHANIEVISNIEHAHYSTLNMHIIQHIFVIEVKLNIEQP